MRFNKTLLLPLLFSVLLVSSAQSAEISNDPLDIDIEKLKESAKSGDPAAQATLGNKYADGEGIDFSDVKALKWCKKSADKGNAEGQQCLGSLYANGVGVPLDMVKAKSWWELSANQGLAKAQFNLGLLYASGEGVPESQETAAHWWTLAAEQGQPDAENNLGWLYEKGTGVKANKATALMWYRKAAAQGSEAAQENVERISPEGIAARCNRAIESFESNDKDIADILNEAAVDIAATHSIPQTSIKSYKSYYNKQLADAEAQAKYSCPNSPAHEVAVKKFMPRSTDIYNRLIANKTL